MGLDQFNDGDASFSIVGVKSAGNYLSIKRDSQDPDGTGTLSYQWQSSDSNYSYSSWTNIGTKSSYRVQSNDSDKYIRATICTIRGCNSFNNSRSSVFLFKGFNYNAIQTT